LWRKEPGNIGGGGALAVYFRYVIIHVISIGNATFGAIITQFLEGHVRMINSWRIYHRKKQQNASEESDDIDCSRLRPQISKLENQAISEQYSKQVSLHSELQCSYSRKF